MRTLVAICTTTLLASPAFAQSGIDLSRAFEGRTVVLKMDMPATSTGVEVKPLTGTPIDYGRLASLIKSYGIGVHSGESVMVTKVIVKEHHIEFQLGGGGYGTASDAFAAAAKSAPTVPYEYKSHREKDLETELQYTYGYYDRKALKQEIQDMDRDRYRDNTTAVIVNAQSQAIKAQKEAAARARGGSRFNIRYNDGFPQGALTPAGVMRTLAPYLSFEMAEGPYSGWAAPAAATPVGATALRKGLTVLQVEQILGPAAHVGDRPEGSITINVREYRTERQVVSARFAGGVLIDYTITPR
jgi:hypothetical protein